MSDMGDDVFDDEPAELTNQQVYFLGRLNQAAVAAGLKPYEVMATFKEARISGTDDYKLMVDPYFDPQNIDKKRAFDRLVHALGMEEDRGFRVSKRPQIPLDEMDEETHDIIKSIKDESAKTDDILKSLPSGWSLVGEANDIDQALDRSIDILGKKGHYETGGGRGV